MRARTSLPLGLLAAALVMIGSTLSAAAQAPGEGGPATMQRPAPEPLVALTGTIESDGEKGFNLVDAESGESIVLKKKAKKLAAHEGSKVTLMGRWAKGDESTGIFKVSKVEAASPAAVATDSAAANPAGAEPAPAEAPVEETPEWPAPEESADPESPETSEPDSHESPAPEAP